MTGATRRPMQARGFLFADLRGYTAFVEARGDEAAAELLRTYRGIVRGVIARFDGAEIRTEGDSFYVVFRSASDAVLAGLRSSKMRPRRPSPCVWGSAYTPARQRRPMRATSAGRERRGAGVRRCWGG
jgi:class 3 adenylate cyclase